MTTEQKANDPQKTEKLTGTAAGGTNMESGGDAGEDEGGVPKEGDDSNVKEDQKPITK